MHSIFYGQNYITIFWKELNFEKQMQPKFLEQTTTKILK